MHNRKIALFQGQIETALKNFRADLELRLKKLFAVLHVKSHLTGAGIRKREGFPPINLLFVLTNLAFLHIATVHNFVTQDPSFELISTLSPILSITSPHFRGAKLEHKVVDSKIEIYDVHALKEIKAIHEKIAGHAETDQDLFFAKRLLNDLKCINITNNIGNVMVESPGAIQGHTINVKISKKNISVNAPPGTIGFDVNLSGYVQHLIKRYNEFDSSDPTR